MMCSLVIWLSAVVLQNIDDHRRILVLL